MGKIKNKIVRQQQYMKALHQKNKDKLERRKERAKEEEKDPEKKRLRLSENIPATIESKRVYDETIIEDKPDEELQAELKDDEFSAYFSEERKVPKLLVTTSKRASRKCYDFASELLDCFPNAEFRKRTGDIEVHEIAEAAAKRGYTDLLVLNEDRKKTNALTLVHLPNGPSFYFTLSNLQTAKEISNHGRSTGHIPELIINNFSTRLGMTVARAFQSLFIQTPQIQGRQVVTIHCQRDFLFFRRHRYAFREKSNMPDGIGTGLQELGPRFTMRLRMVQKGVWDRKEGEVFFESNAGEESDRRKFWL
ncbi:Brix domain-containing protein C4F8.04 [Schizosaccharomyces pombe]|uniref:Brix domain-containing protein C4F8.04 n=1 Tax=Schizosaccharomyces pombe (strain 972 / ATCC 24843) TaxID=284812 RepID=YDS4_SCHPO|nr:putative Brix domain-containing protein Rpf1 [Schizosaccharomyces pombe]O14180.1 RecName: Full=Brix domain-containing protein C4F8.04 [Schizosaccharomyces pombe 972h-]8ESQ_x Chain x, Brix domain-containing protein C4F8.04 [Schizosaccharomyces pombe]8ETH_x Chain x, Brix domain-containing protein C4F8.04 [Schizosaccharomyces pombe]8ETI_x Chain x, Brix domain-containing protein C4F8.04 [Schizosaccharomyces pombe]8EUP_x Chain x, Brix domain-containing protein C4F8.04 [Schizosaccharomyces pombe]|eukprot:NP_593868.1 putative Brix domain-containing protein Rpf1 [Schizosaccharomyces pombe]